MKKPFSAKICSLILAWLNGAVKEGEIRELTDYDWALIDEVARRKAITSFIFYKFKELDSLRFIPQAIRDSWQQHFYNNLKRNEIALQELTKVLSQLSVNHVEVVILKGASLLIDGYPNAGIRPMGDVDILIKKDDFSRSIQPLNDAGLNLISEKPGIPSGEFEADLMFSNKNFVLEIFPNLYQYERFKGILWEKQDTIWQNIRAVNFQSQPLKILSYQDQILHLCYRLCIGNLLKNVIHFLDIKEFITHHKDSLNWEELLDEAKKQNLCNCLYLALVFTKKFFCEDIPGWVIEELKPPWPKRVLISLFINKNYIFSDNDIEGTKRYVLQSLFMDKFLDTFKVALRGLFPSREWFLYRYGQKALRRIYFYRITHLFKILFD